MMVKSLMDMPKHKDKVLVDTCISLDSMRCVLDHVRYDLIEEAHTGVLGGHYHTNMTTRKILQAILWWLNLYRDYRG